jgi:SulP family sulfate permease
LNAPRLHLAGFHPRLIDSVRGYSRARFLADAGAGMTVGIVALPLAMAFAIASGLSPQAGLWTAIIAGFLISALGGSSVQIGGPAGAFIVIVYGIVERYGLANLLISTACAGVLLFTLGLLKLGTLVRYVPVSIVIGFTNGIAVLIAASQLRDWLGLTVPKLPADFFTQLKVMGQHLDSFNPYAFGLGLACVLGLALWPRLWNEKSAIRHAIHQALELPGMGRALQVTSRMPGPIVALVTLTVFAWFLKLPVETIGSRFGGIPQGLPSFALPDFSWEAAKQLVTPTLTIALLGAIESLLCARVADKLAPQQPRHDPNQELMAQGVANIVTPLLRRHAGHRHHRPHRDQRAQRRAHAAGRHGARADAAGRGAGWPRRWRCTCRWRCWPASCCSWPGTWASGTSSPACASSAALPHHPAGHLPAHRDVRPHGGGGGGPGAGLRASSSRRMSSLFRVELTGSTDSANGNQLTYKLYGALFFGAVAKIDVAVQAVETGPDAPQVVLDALQLVSLDASGLDALRQLHKAVLARGGTLRVDHLQAQPRALFESSGFAAELAATP